MDLLPTDLIISILYFIDPLKMSLISKEYCEKNKHIISKKKLIDSFIINYLIHEYEYNMFINATTMEQLYAIKKYYKNESFMSDVVYCRGNSNNNVLNEYLENNK